MARYGKLLKLKVARYKDYPGINPEQFDTINLRYCPFCNGKARVKELPMSHLKAAHSLSVQCTRCGVEPYVYFKSKVEVQDVVDIWNGINNEDDELKEYKSTYTSKAKRERNNANYQKNKDAVKVKGG